MKSKKTLFIILLLVLVIIFVFVFGSGSGKNEISQDVKFLVDGEIVAPDNQNIVPVTKYLDENGEYFAALVSKKGEDGDEMFLNFGNQSDESIIAGVRLGKNVAVQPIIVQESTFNIIYSVDGAEVKSRVFEVADGKVIEK